MQNVKRQSPPPLSPDRVPTPFSPFSFSNKLSKIITKLERGICANDAKKYKYHSLERIQKSKLPVRENYLISMKVSVLLSKELWRLEKGEVKLSSQEDCKNSLF